MAKKSRRVRKKSREIHLSPSQLVQPGEEIADAAIAAAAARPRSKVANLQEEYRYVIADLRRIGIIAVGMLAVLIALAFLLT